MGIFDFINDINNYESRAVGRDTVNGLIISTCYTSDEGYETAILDENGTYPVERYSNKEEAKMGHIKWVANSKSLTAINMLGWQDGLLDGKIVLLKRKTNV